MFARTALLLLCCLVGVAFCHEAAPQAAAASAPKITFRPEFAGSDYGDVIDAVRGELDEAAAGGKKDNPGTIQRITFLLTKISNDISREQASSDRLNARIGVDYKTRVTKLDETIKKTTTWMATTSANISTNVAKVAMLEAFLKKAPTLISIKTEEAKQVTIKKATLQAIRNRENHRFHKRAFKLRDSVYGINNAMHQLGYKNTSTEFNTTFSKALKATNGTNMKFRSLIASLAPWKLKGAADVTDVYLLLTAWHKECHEFLASITATEVKWAARWVSIKNYMTSQRAALDAIIKNLHTQIPAAKKEIASRSRVTSKLNAEADVQRKVLKRAQAAVKSIKKSHDPLLATYTRHKQHREDQLAVIQQLQTFIASRWKSTPRTKPAVTV